MTAPYQVFVEGPRDKTPAALAQLAAAMATRYGIPAAELERRLARGRFRVKADADRTTAEQYVRDLERLGAICTVVDATGATVDLSAPRGGALPPPLRTQAASAPKPPLPSPLPPRAALPPSPARPSTGSALAAAGRGRAADLGALVGDGAMALASLDGADESEAAIEPTSLPASFGPATGAAPPTARRDMTGPPVNLFAAPELEAEVELDVDVVAERAKKAVSMPPPVASTAPRATAAPHTSVAPPLASAPLGAPVMASAGASPRQLLARPRVRFAAGVMIALVLGFIPATIIAGIREDAAFAEIDDKLDQRQAAVESPEEYAALDQTRARALDRKYADRRDIALVAVVIWAAIGAGVAYAWFRRIPWDRFAAD